MRAILRRIQKKFSRPFDTRPQTYEVNYEVSVKNTSSSKKELNLILPIPPQTPNQQRQSDIKLWPKGTVVKKDKLFGNQYVLWQINFKPQESRLYQLSFKVLILPAAADLKKNYLMNEYKKISQKAEKFLAASPHLQSDNPRIKNLAEKIKRREKNVLTIIKNLNQYVISHLSYGRPIQGLYSALEALDNKITDCGGFSSLFVSLCLALGIPARIISGFWAGWPKNTMHAWLEIMLPDGRWIPADPSVEFLARQNRTKKSGRLGFIGSDRIIFSFGCDIPIEIGNKTVVIDILQNPFLYSENGLDDFEIEMGFEAKRLRKS
ncbi:MAG: hypothetical protein A3I88_01030 [Candidatus Portnoybacteria bacterium RIFCSPLOWO2_12_FULL_39_9]|uniref:Transglutaminase-like domain-containing protein n=1 Tax=Candidatus Portnoybacteria bacterium RIFCSPHIGHO2_12_FULL_38_9 TaxID=1801997 RepID=A0A1G2FIE9_9BACT|nr:MAG: hypothetical protein UT09_C0038G0006 [Parcubacteria group bacterium GW2011_GWF2_38_8]OGZ32009.1 MAG: hypothetical protein A3H00_00040 [Candidatus Portnoybacteria bacterium RBG_13_40_8]OGZ36698.1 MAG: hypothetical protein A2646_02245 [Candidatus Portnoybacteria bacterium RIFCSPHIGHO2_02_FULL_39_12]OGZ37607.1 MAG: hypothetical protein A3J64_01960 [Candidatus Portnoybacteria bacterium RIFCSPHIGHO2_12_FULL_38_9]OGZ38958.1 MAG: hypothetical protein A3F21_03800 [Candidatus Portnoybacteria bac